MRSFRPRASVMSGIRKDGLVTVGGGLLGLIGILYAFGCAPPPPDTLTYTLGPGVTIELIKIPAGSFQMGTASTEYTDLSYSRPVHTVTFAEPYYMGKHEVTQAQWRAVMETNPSHFSGNNRPVERVSWDDAVAFCQALSTKVGRTIRLPSEAEWEYSCKAGSGDTKYYFGNDGEPLGTCAWYFGNSGGQTHDAGGKTPNPWGLFDMYGNVWEWCQDVWHNDYTGSPPSDGSAWTTGGNATHRVLRGGSWFSASSGCLSAFRVSGTSDIHDASGGFRVATGMQ
jgi:eukaryotic-like serine/threonine-protein kinase